MTVAGLKGRSTARTLPRWKGVKYLTDKASAIFQKRALEIASEQRIPRVHLDIYLTQDFLQARENRNKELKTGLRADRLSDHRYFANLIRLYLHTAA